MGKNIGEKIEQCFYFSLNSLTKTINNIADKHFKKLNISSSYAYLIMQIYDKPGIGTKDLSWHLNLKPSTVTRLVDKMVNERYLKREQNGKRISISCTKLGRKFCKKIIKTWSELNKKFSEDLGKERLIRLNKEVIRINNKIRKDENCDCRWCRGRSDNSSQA